MQTEIPTTAVDTNEEYISTQNAVKEPAVLGTVFRAVIIETIKDFFGSIFGFFMRYIRHFIDCLRYFWSPSLKKHPFDKKDYKENCQHSFELVMIVLFAIIFLVKLDLIPPTTKALLDIYNNDVTQMVMQLMIFLIFALTYIILIIFSILSGRLFRLLFKIKIARRESDILHIYLTNALFSFASLVALWARCSTSNETGDAERTGLIIWSVFILLCLPLFFTWSIRFAKLNGLSISRRITFTILATVLYTFFFSLADAMVTMFLVGI